MGDTYASTRDRLELYFDRTASRTWERLTSDAPVSRIRQTVRAGRDQMRTLFLSHLPADLTGARILDAGCGAGPMTVELAARGAKVVATDISPSLLEVAFQRTPVDLRARVEFVAGDMLDPDLGHFDHVVAMDSLIHYSMSDIAGSLARLTARTRSSVLFTVAPRTPLLNAMHLTGKLFPRGDRSPRIVPTSAAELGSETRRLGVGQPICLGRVTSGFYISEAMEIRR